MANWKSGNVILLTTLTLVTVLGIMSMRPQEYGWLPDGINQYIPYGELGDSIPMDPREDIYFNDFVMEDLQTEEAVIDNETLQRFIIVYVEKINDKTINQDFIIENQEQVRNLLEGMGYDNTTQLKTVLNEDLNEDTIRKVQAILSENLFEHELNRLYSLLIQ
ncbi:MAG: hypothetical protein AB2421_14295 [Thermotaleaceae bacterium]